ncbi:prepilin peptidase [Henriciella aquimarina]|uniref:prepilin peptidase n=1 Tax=Henriciella aquimarina TaxID=545261 RepID=UPI001301BA4E|nr:A24 family peptidase [Henriciella aquimarina]
MPLPESLLILASPFAGMLAGWLAANWRLEGLQRLGPPACEACGRKPGWTAWTPFLDVALMRGRCPACQAPAGWLQTVCEMAGILVSLSALAFAPAGTLILSCLFGWTLLALAAIDWRTFLLPNVLTFLAVALGLLMLCLTKPINWPDHLIGGAAGYLLLLAVELFYRYSRGRDGLGRGDAKLLGALGLWIGWQGLPDILLVSSLCALIAALLMSWRSGESLRGTTALPFGPWLALAGWTIWLTGPLMALLS